MEAPSSNPRQSLLIHANIAPRTGPGLGYLGMTSVKAFGILIGAQGEGVGAQSAPRSGNSVIGTSGDQRWKPLNRTPNSTLMRQVHANLGHPGMQWDVRGGGRGAKILNAERDPGPEIGLTIKTEDSPEGRGLNASGRKSPHFRTAPRRIGYQR
jgi:hypothetical protein